MQMCYVDESGDTGPFAVGERNSQPVFVLCALLLDQTALESLTRETIDLKKRWVPALGQHAAHWHDWLRIEYKGADIRRSLREGTHRATRHALGFLDAVLALLERHSVRLAARVYVKEPGEAFNGANVYSAAMQHLAETFEEWLLRASDKGIMVLDSRNKAKNVPVSHSLFTRVFRTQGPAFRHIAELPLFGHSDNHALLQMADWVGSALLAPMAARAYCSSHEAVCVHASPVFETVRARFGQRIKALQFRYLREGKKMGGVNILGGHTRLNPLLLFGPPPAAPR